MIVPRTKQIVQEFYRRTPNTMRKLMSLMLGLSLIMGAVSISFAADDKKEETPKKKKKKKKDGDEKK